MNVKLVYDNKIETYDTIADGSASISYTSLRLSGNALKIWSQLRFDKDFSDKGETKGWPNGKDYESTFPTTVLQLKSKQPHPDIATFLTAAHDELGLLRLDVDGETLYQYEEPAEEEDSEPDASVEQVPVFDPSHPTKAGLDAALKQKFGY